MSQKVEELHGTKARESQQVLDLEQVNVELQRQMHDMEEAVGAVKESGERQVRELTRENELLQDTVQTLRARNEKTNDARMRDTERENKRLGDSVKQLTAELSQVTYEKRKTEKSLEQVSADAQLMRELEEENRCVERENEELRKNVTTLELRCDKLERLEHAG